MTRAPDVSVIVPVYNPGTYLGTCLDSLVCQSLGHERFEIVAVDDGSTDGSADVLAAYAHRYPDLFRVISQENSGGPARPCNVGLRAATGRYVFFLGSDDYLGEQALERMVGHADRLGSDVLAAKMVGVGGRGVKQLLFAQDAEAIPFPSRALVLGLSNTKLFRRSLLTEYGIEYALDLRIGSDQPFTVEALLRARKISAVADYTYYYAVRRDDSTNLTYSSTWRTRFECISAVMDYVARLIPDAHRRDQVLWRHFSSELSKMLRFDLPTLDDEEATALVTALQRIAERHLSPTIVDDLSPTKRLRLGLALRGRVSELRTVADLEETPLPLALGGDEHIAVDLEALGIADIDATFTRIADDKRSRTLQHALGTVRLAMRGPVLRVTAPCGLANAFQGLTQVSLRKPHPDGGSRAARDLGTAPAATTRTAPARIDQGILTAEHDLASMPGLDSRAWALRCEVRNGDTVHTAPFMIDEPWSASVGIDGATYDLRVWPDDNGRALLTLAKAPNEETG